MSRPRRSSRRRKSPEQLETRRKNIIGAGLIGAVVLAVGIVAVFYQTVARTEIDPETGCPVSGAVSITAVVIDGSDRIAPRQQAFIRNHLEAIQQAIPIGGALEVYKLGIDPETLLEPVVSACNPGRGSDVDPTTGSPVRAERLWQEVFQSRLQAVFDRLLNPDEEELSPIFESIQSVGITRFANPQWQNKPKRLVLVSDMIQFTPEFSHYQGAGEFSSFSAEPYYRRVRTDLSGVEVTVLYVPRTTRNSVQGPAHWAFWTSYFLDQGGRSGEPALFVHVEG